MGAVVETPSIYVDMTAEDNLKEQYRILGLPSFEGISELLQLVGLENTGKKKAKNFSLGMKQRLGIAIALAGDPDFLVLDEPVQGVDVNGQLELYQLIAQLRERYGCGVLMVSHDLHGAMKDANKVLVVNKGISFWGSLEEYRKYSCVCAERAKKWLIF